MKVEFRGKEISIRNTSVDVDDFYCEWNGYQIEMFLNERERFVTDTVWRRYKYDVYVKNLFGEYIAAHEMVPTKSEGLCFAFECIDSDLEKIEERANKIKEMNEKYGEDVVREILGPDNHLDEMERLLEKVKSLTMKDEEDPLGGKDE